MACSFKGASHCYIVIIDGRNFWQTEANSEENDGSLTRDSGRFSSQSGISGNSFEVLPLQRRVEAEVSISKTFVRIFLIIDS